MHRHMGAGCRPLVRAHIRACDPCAAAGSGGGATWRGSEGPRVAAGPHEGSGQPPAGRSLYSLHLPLRLLTGVGTGVKLLSGRCLFCVVSCQPNAVPCREAGSAAGAKPTSLCGNRSNTVMCVPSVASLARPACLTDCVRAGVLRRCDHFNNLHVWSACCLLHCTGMHVAAAPGT